MNATTRVSILRTGSPALSVGALTTSGNVYAKSAYARPTAPGEVQYAEATVHVVSGSFSAFKVLFQWQRSPSGPTQLASATFLGPKARMTFSSPAPAETTTSSVMVLGVAVTGPGDVFAVDQASFMGAPVSLAPANWVQYTGNNAVFGTVNGNAVDDYGDPVDLASPIATGVPISLIEQSSRILDPTTQEPRTVRFLTGRFYAVVDVQSGDRLLDESDGTLYIIDAVTRPKNAVGLGSIRLDLRREGE